MTVLIDLQNDDGLEGVPTVDDLLLWVEASLRQPYDCLEQTIRIVDKAESQTLNRQYRGKEVPTNVLSFPADVPHIEYQCLGDLVICAPLVTIEAEQQGKIAREHWAHLVVHGMLHLQGQDHQNGQDAEKMEALEVEILSTLGYSNPYNIIASNFTGSRSDNG